MTSCKVCGAELSGGSRPVEHQTRALHQIRHAMDHIRVSDTQSLWLEIDRILREEQLR